MQNPQSRKHTGNTSDKTPSPPPTYLYKYKEFIRYISAFFVPKRKVQAFI